jgi:hypothetical protein
MIARQALYYLSQSTSPVFNNLVICVYVEKSNNSIRFVKKNHSSH